MTNGFGKESNSNMPVGFSDIPSELNSGGGIGGIDLEKLLAILNKSLWWIILFVVMSLSGAYLYLRYTKPIYESYSILKLDIQKRADELLGLKDDEGSGANLVGEIEIIKSQVLYEQVLEKIDLSVTYQQSGNFLSSELYTITPFKVVYEVKNSAFYNVPISLEFIDDKQYIMKYDLVGVENSEIFKFNTAYENEFLKLVSPYKNSAGSLCLFDDCLEDINETNSKIFTKISHHEKCNVIFLTQNLFADNKHYRVMSRNATYIIIMKNPRDVSQVKIFANQMGVGENLLLDAYKAATKKAYSYLMIDLHPTTPEHIRLRTNIFPNEMPMTVFMQKNAV